MTEPEALLLSPHSLQDYVDCARRFQLRYLLAHPSPALVAGSPLEFEALVQRGLDFHRLVRQHRLGLDPGRLAATIHDERLAQWWQTYLAHPPANLPEEIVRPEVNLAVSLAAEVPGGRFRLAGRLDLLAAAPGERLVIVDWKTVTRLPEREALAGRLQTRVYPLLAVEAGAAYFGGQRPRPEQVELVYWFAEHGGHTESFAYDEAQHAAGLESLAALAAEIAARREPIWPLTPDRTQCRYCVYRSLCDRGVHAGPLEGLEDDLEAAPIEIDLEQVAEIEF